MRQAVAAERFDPDGTADPADLRVLGWAWYTVGTAVFLVGTDEADPARQPGLGDSRPGPFWRISDIARIVEHGDDDPVRVNLARELMAGVMADVAKDGGIGKSWGGK